MQRLGATSGTAANFFEGVIGADVGWRSALTDAEMLEAHTLLIDKGQTLRTDSDVDKGQWTPFAASPTTLWDKIDEIVADDADYITATI